MELYKEILIKILEKEEALIRFPNLKINATEIVKPESYKALYEIKKILENNSLSGAECFAKIERIICIFEQIGSNTGERHDF